VQHNLKWDREEPPSTIHKIIPISLTRFGKPLVTYTSNSQ